MGFWQGFAVLTFVHLLAAASPGPDFALVTRQSLLRGRRAGLAASLGIALGLAVHIAYSAAGLAAVIAHRVEWMTVLKVVGGAYLIYLGVMGLCAKRKGAELTVDEGAPTDRRDVLAGFLCNVLNPKAPIYFVSLFTLVLSPDLPALTLLIYGLWIMVLQFLWFAGVTFLFSRRSIRMRFLSIAHWIDRVFGAAMTALGIRVLVSIERPIP